MSVCKQGYSKQLINLAQRQETVKTTSLALSADLKSSPINTDDNKRCLLKIEPVVSSCLVFTLS